jgi:tetratricopeptide (TPR) repeat protein
MNYQELFAQELYEEAITELKIELQLDPNDEKRSLLAFCWFILGNFEESLRVVQDIANLTDRDYIVLAHIHWEYRNWEEMAMALRESLRINPSGYTYYCLTVAERQGRNLFKIDAASKEIMQSYLIRAMKFEDCPVEAYLLLVDLYDFQDLEKKVDTLNRAFQNYPDNAIVRFQLSSTLIHHQGENERAITILTPLVGTENFDQKARWYIFEALVNQKEYSDADKYLDSIEINNKDGYISIKSDLLFRQGNFGDWLALSAENIDQNNFEPIIKYYFKKAYVNIYNNNLQQAINDFVSGAELLIGIVDYIYSWIDISINGEHYLYKEFDVIADVCENLVLLKDENELLTQQSIGLLIYTIQRYFYEDRQNELLAFFPDLSESPLLFSAKLLGYPPNLCYELTQEIIDKDIIQAIHYYLKYAIWKCESDEYLLNNFSNKIYINQSEIRNGILEYIDSINEIALSELRKCQNPEIIIKVFVPFYNAVWRNLLFKKGLFDIVAEISKKIVDASNKTQGLFDYAYSLNSLGNRDEAEAIYLILIDQQPDNSAAINNLGVIYEKKGLLDEAFSLFSKALQLDPSDKIHSSNYSRLKSLIDRKNESLIHAKSTIEKIKNKAASVGLSEEKLIEFNKYYWEIDLTIKSIQEKCHLTSYSYNRIYSFVIPHFLDEKCPNCFIDLTYKSRSAKSSEDKTCIGCGHQSRGWCSCEYCKKIQVERKQKAERVQRQKAIEEFNNLKEQYCKQEYVEWAIAKLSRREKMFLKSYIEVIQNSENPTWQQVCEGAGVVSHKIYLKKLENLKLILRDQDDRLFLNSAVELSMIELVSVRKISSSIRFDIFQRDNHTCQYCGRTPPEVKLVVDHLIPVAQGGTDVFENLATSCEECNSGKSAKLIKDFTGGFNKEEWSKHIRAKRLQILKERREKLDEIMQHWASSLKKRSLSQKDNTAIEHFIERYEPDWIKAAIDIAVRKEIQDYVKYTAGILKNWARESPPEYLSNPDVGLAKKPATAKQITYIASLLERDGISLSDVSDKTDFDELTMLDARNLISVLLEEMEE